MTDFQEIMKISGQRVRDLNEKRVSMPTCVLLKVTPGSRDDSEDNDQNGIPYNFDYLTPHPLTARNSVCSVSDCNTGRRRPISLKIMPRLSFHGKSTSAPTTTITTEEKWPMSRSQNIHLSPTLTGYYDKGNEHKRVSFREEPVFPLPLMRAIIEKDTYQPENFSHK